ncbi:MAG: PilZ domain-containing protein [Hyphomicrobiales bacterium]|nr:PilZ domain-containing protein [Hyphomicrobiales bacterium]
MAFPLPRAAVKPLERRRFRRVKASLPGRYMLENKQEYPCQTIDMSPGGLRVAAPVKGALGERIVFYFEDFGRLEGTVVRVTGEGFAVEMNLLSSKRERLADLLTWLVNRDDGADEFANRRHKRITPRRQAGEMVTADGARIPVKIVDVSVSGVGLQAQELPPIGARVDIGRRTGKVVRHFNGGLAVEFQRLIPIEEFDEDIVL